MESIDPRPPSPDPDGGKAESTEPKDSGASAANASESASVESSGSASAAGSGRPQPVDLAGATSAIYLRKSRAEFSRVSRRELLKLAPILALGAFAIPGVQESLLKKGLGFSDWISSALFRRGHLAPTFADSELTAFDKFPINDYDVDDPGIIFENWSLAVSGAVQKPGDYRLEQIQSLPLMRQNTRHVCVEGWDVIGRFGGTRLSNFLSVIGADTSARFIAVSCADDYYETLDMATALHPQTLLCWEMYDQPLTREHGAPLRLNVPTKVGYKQAKYLTGLKVTNIVEKVGYWEDQGYSGYYGL